jgi:hypothetical protein
VSSGEPYEKPDGDCEREDRGHEGERTEPGSKRERDRKRNEHEEQDESDHLPPIPGPAGR